jgi:hypothetical protein
MQNGFTAADCHTVQSSPSTSISSFPSLSHLHQQSYKSENAQFCGDHDPTDTRQQDPHYMVDTNVNGTAAAINHFVGKSIAEKEGTVTSSKSWT